MCCGVTASARRRTLFAEAGIFRACADDACFVGLEHVDVRRPFLAPEDGPVLRELRAYRLRAHAGAVPRLDVQASCVRAVRSRRSRTSGRSCAAQRKSVRPGSGCITMTSTSSAERWCSQPRARLDAALLKPLLGTSEKFLRDGLCRTIRACVCACILDRSIGRSGTRRRASRCRLDRPDSASSRGTRSRPYTSRRTARHGSPGRRSSRPGRRRSPPDHRTASRERPRPPGRRKEARDRRSRRGSRRCPRSCSRSSTLARCSGCRGTGRRSARVAAAALRPRRH